MRLSIDRAYNVADFTFKLCKNKPYYKDLTHFIRVFSEHEVADMGFYFAARRFLRARWKLSLITGPTVWTRMTRIRISPFCFFFTAV